MREYVHLHRKALASWVFEDPRRWHFFSFLLMKADERGRVEVSVNDYAKKYGIDRSWLRRCINEMIDRNIIDQQTTNKRTIVTICKYEDYNTLTIDECAKSDQQTTNKPTSQEEKKEERERKFPPHPLIKKEKEEKREEAPLLLLNTHEECDFGEETSGDVIDTTRLDAEITVRFRRGDLRGRNRHHTARCRNHGAGLQPAENGGAGHARAPHRGRGEGAPEYPSLSCFSCLSMLKKKAPPKKCHFGPSKAPDIWWCRKKAVSLHRQKGKTHPRTLP